MLFPQLGPAYYDEGDKPILGRMEAAYSAAIMINQSYWSEADTDTRFFSGDQTLWQNIYGNLPAHTRKTFNFNRIRRVINMISGHQRRNRKSTVCTPIENGDDETADQFTKALLWVNNQEQVLDTISEAFEGALITGMNLLQVWVDYRSDPVSGNIKIDNNAYNNFMIDPYFRKSDLSDCNFVWKRSFLTKREAISLYPDQAEIILGLIGVDSGTARDGKFQFMPESYNYGYKNLLSCDEFWYRDYRTQKMLVDTNTGGTQEWVSDDKDALKQFMEIYPEITVIDQDIPTVRLAIVCAGRVLYDGPNPLGVDKYPFIPVMAYYRPEMPYFPYRIQGVVRGLRDAQYLYNRRRIIELDILESQINSGWIYKENALVNPKDVFLSGQGRGLALKDEAQMTDVQQIVAPQVPPSMIQLSELLAKEISEVSGVNEELLGSANDDKAGILSMLRQGAGLTTLQVLFDQLDRSQRLLGKVMIDIIQANFTPGKMKRILQEEPTNQFYHKSFGRYDAAVEEGLNTTTQKQMQLSQMLHLREVGIPISDEDLIEATTFQGKKKIVENMQRQKQEQKEMQQMSMQAQMQELASKVELNKARAVADEGLGYERYSRVKENEALAVERKAAAEKDRSLALLDFVKALKELEGTDLAHLKELIGLSQMLKDSEDINSDKDLKKVDNIEQR